MPSFNHNDLTQTPADTSIAASRVLRQFRVVFNAVKAHFRQVERVAGIGGAQLWALSMIGATPGIGVNALARGLDIHQSTASNLIKGLIERGLVASKPCAGDRRAHALHILAPGTHILQMAPAPFSGVLPDALGCLDAATLGRLETDLSSLIVLLGANNDGANTPLADL